MNHNRLYSVLFSGLKWFCTVRTSLSKCVSFFSGVVCSDGSSSIRSFISSPTKVKSIAFCRLSSSMLYAVKFLSPLTYFVHFDALFSDS